MTFAADSGVREGGELIATPTLVDLTGDDRPEIVIGAQEEYEEPPNIGDGASMLTLLGGISDLGNSRLYAISPDGRNATNPDRSAVHPDDQAYVPGWPAALGQLGLEVLPTIGDGITTQVAAGDVAPASRDRDRRGRPPRARRTCSTRPATPSTARSAARRCPRRGPVASRAKARRGSVRSATPTTSR